MSVMIIADVQAETDFRLPLAFLLYFFCVLFTNSLYSF